MPPKYPCPKDFRRVKGTLLKRVPLWVQGKALPSFTPGKLPPLKQIPPTAIAVGGMIASFSRYATKE